MRQVSSTPGRTQCDSKVGRLIHIPVIGALHQRQLLFPIVVALVVLGVLLQGVLESDRPVEASGEDESPSALVVVRRPDAARRPNLEKTPLTYFDDYWGQLRARVENRVVLVGPAATPAVVVMPGLALSSAAAGEAVLAELERARLVRAPESAAALERRDAGLTDDRSGDGEPPDDGDATPADEPETPVATVRPHGLIAVDRDRGLSLFEVDPSRYEAFQLVPPAAVPSGAYIGAVTRDRTGRAVINVGHLVAARAEERAAGDPSLAVSMSLSGPGATAVVNLDGELIGMAVARGDAGQAPYLFSSSVIRRMVADLQEQRPCRALVVAALDPAALDLLGLSNGLLIEHVRQDAFYPEPSLQPGDVILEWDGQAVTTVEDFDVRSTALEPGALVRYRILRGRRRMTGGTILPDDDCRPVADPAVRLERYGLALRWSATGPTTEGAWRVAATASGGVAATAGLEPGDLLLAVDGRPVEDPDDRGLFERLEQRGGSALFTVRRADQVRMLALIPGE